ncbi:MULTISPECIES: NAD(P)H-dependent flavin oxidoreductase [Lactiplantibacillus]|uniref:NAD(P)H-dependent flavin oxidoreductase n=1 Tax=Lactiplantibacillus TaxID=2767842 RepID=UPI0020A6F173|nr:MULTISPECIES: nitronate monooxygenase [Lactiplantibacillus]MDY1545124.1 nitronate monooxygenase [Lactiplantibacillus pentosus]
MVINSITSLLKTKYPLVQAPMNWLTDAKLVAAVSNAGGLGVFGPNPSQTKMIHGAESHMNQMRHQIRLAKQLTDHEFGINIVIEDKPAIHMNETLKVAFEENLHYFAVVGDPNQAVYDQIKAHSGIIIARPLTPTIYNAQLAEKLGADVFVATGYDEGGILPQSGQGTFTAIPMIADALNIPVLAAGGINDHRGVNAALALGADGVYVGSRFLVAEEAPTSLAAKQAILRGKYSEMVLISHDQRALINTFTKKLATDYAQHHDGQKNDLSVSNRGGLLPGMRLGKCETDVISVNTGIDLIRSCGSVQQIVKDLMQDMNK